MSKIEIEKEIAKQEKIVVKKSEARFSLAPGSSRARVTSANAAWWAACQQLTRLQDMLAA